MESVARVVERLGELADSAAVSRLAAAFSAAGHELALVGGSVRDAFLNRDLTDLDFTTSARPDDILALVTPISDVQWDVGRDFGTIAARINGLTVEITTYRADAYDGETRKPIVQFGDTLEDDLVRRDFTVNAMALRLPERQLVDPWGGLDDLLARRISTPGAPEVSFGDDPLRMLRAARFTSQLGFTVADDRTLEDKFIGIRYSLNSNLTVRGTFHQYLKQNQSQNFSNRNYSIIINQLDPEIEWQPNNWFRLEGKFSHSLGKNDAMIGNESYQKDEWSSIFTLQESNKST